MKQVARIVGDIDAAGQAETVAVISDIIGMFNLSG